MGPLTVPYSTFSKTYNVNAQVPDSAGTMTAMVSGVKTRIGVVSVGPDQARGVCAGSENHWLPTILEKAEDRGLMTGIVTATCITHATPAALYAHVPERDWESDVNLPQTAKDEGCVDIATQLTTFNHGDGIDVILDGGRQQFLSAEQTGPKYPSVKGTRRWLDIFEIVKSGHLHHSSAPGYQWPRASAFISRYQDQA